MKHYMDISEVHAEEIRDLSDNFRGRDLQGHEIGFNNYYMVRDGQPLFGVSGEIHYARVARQQWEDSILKMKMCGVNVISTYCFWIHHEEIEGRFRFDGNRDFRAFVELCGKHGLYVIIRIGPFDHGECRNGGFPDWLYGKPFEARTTDPGFLFCVRRLYRKISEQLSGLFFKDGGPIIGTQPDNEYMHSAAPWEMTAGLTNEWCTGGHEGDAYLLALKKIAQEEGIIPAFYTCTGWGGAATPVDDMLPLHGGYAYWPWIYYDYSGPHPVTPEYIYRYYHNNAVPATYNFEPVYEPQSIPCACCEMGGGGGNAYKYRVATDYMNVDAMANVKLAGGCNFLGYYMFGRGNQPKGERQTFLNEGQCPKIDYDGDCPLGVSGQLRPSYYRMKAVYENGSLCVENPTWPQEAKAGMPENTQTATMKFYPPVKLRTESDVTLEEECHEIFSCQTVSFRDVEPIALHAQECGPFRYKVSVPRGTDRCKNLLLRIRYDGDVGMAFFDGELVSDNYCNGTIWGIGLRDVQRPAGDEMTILIPPGKHSDIDVSSTMAGRMEIMKNAAGSLDGITVQPVREAVFSIC